MQKESNGIVAILAVLVAGLLPVRASVAAETSTPPVQVSRNGGLLFKSPDGQFSLGLGVLLQTRAEAGVSNHHLVDGAAVRMVRPQVRGFLHAPWLTYFVQPELAGPAPKLLDLQLTAQPRPEIGVTVGQFVTPFSRTFLTPVPKLLFPDFSMANERFRGDRDTGVQVQGEFASGKVAYAIGAFNGNGIGKVGVSSRSGGNDDARLALIGRVSLDPLGKLPLDEAPTQAGSQPLRFSVGLQGMRGELAKARTDTSAAGTEKQDTIGLDFAAMWRRAHVQAEGYWRQTTSVGGSQTTSRGAYSHAGIMLVPTQLELAGRYSLLQPNTLEPNRNVQVTEAQLVGYLTGHRAKAWLRGAHTTDAGVQSWTATLQLQLLL